MKKIFQLLVVITLSLMTFSCYYDEFPEEASLPIPTNVSYQSDIQPLFNQNCISCHGGNTAPDLRSGNSYSALINGGFVIPSDVENSILYKSLKGDGARLMPPSGELSAAKINLVRSWIASGALNN